jgi:hypothetical protein
MILKIIPVKNLTKLVVSILKIKLRLHSIISGRAKTKIDLEENLSSDLRNVLLSESIRNKIKAPPKIPVHLAQMSIGLALTKKHLLSI